jgi:hypothetical protein
MPEITFLFGAGASAQKLPVVNQIPQILTKTIQLLELEKFYLSEDFFVDKHIENNKSKRGYQIELVESLIWLKEESTNHASIDTLAKKLSINRKFSELRKLKLATSVFFAINQTQTPWSKNKIDVRYDSFFASIIDAEHGLPENLKVLTWNYDSQFELAYAEYSNQRDDITANSRALNVMSKNLNKRRTKGFSLIKLNGSAAFHSADGNMSENYSTTYNVKFNVEFLEEIVKKFARATCNSTIVPSLSFAWEEDFYHAQSINAYTANEIRNTQILVVIGYSFPFFNREIDKLNLAAMSNLTKIYYQDIFADDLQVRLKGVISEDRNIEIIPYKDVGQFFIPYEM